MSDQSLYQQDQDPEKLAYSKRLDTAINVMKIAEMLGLSKKLMLHFRHAVYYANTLFDDMASPMDLRQIYTAIGRIESEEIPNVPIMSNDNREVHLQILKDKAILLLEKAYIKGLDETEINLLKILLGILLTKEVYTKAETLVDKIKVSNSEEVYVPIENETLSKYLRMNQRKLEQ